MIDGLLYKFVNKHYILQLVGILLNKYCLNLHPDNLVNPFRIAFKLGEIKQILNGWHPYPYGKYLVDIVLFTCSPSKAGFNKQRLASGD